MEDPLRGVAPGQAAVFYDGDLVVGSATICGTDRAGTTAEQAAGLRPESAPYRALTCAEVWLRWRKHLTSSYLCQSYLGVG